MRTDRAAQLILIQWEKLELKKCTVVFFWSVNKKYSPFKWFTAVEAKSTCMANSCMSSAEGTDQIIVSWGTKVEYKTGEATPCFRRYLSKEIDSYTSQNLTYFFTFCWKLKNVPNEKSLLNITHLRDKAWATFTKTVCLLKSHTS